MILWNSCGGLELQMAQYCDIPHTISLSDGAYLSPVVEASFVYSTIRYRHLK